MDGVFIYWDNSNIFIGAQDVAVEREGESARSRVRIHFPNILKLAHAGRTVRRAVAAGSVPPELRSVWNRLENSGVEVRLLERGTLYGREQGVDQILQTEVLRDGFDNNGDPGTVVMLTGDGAGFLDGVGFHADLSRMQKRGWRIEVVSWKYSCNRRMREWAEQYGVFVSLDDFYDSITFLEHPRQGDPIGDPRLSVSIDLSKRQLAD